MDFDDELSLTERPVGNASQECALSLSLAAMTVDDTLEKLLADHLILIGRLSRILSLRSKDYWTMDDVGLYFNISARQAHRLTRDLPKGPLPGSRVHLVRKNDVLALAKQSIKRPVVESLLEQANKLLLTASDGQNPN